MDETTSMNFDLNGSEMKIVLKINDTQYQVPKYIRPETTLNYFIRNFAHLKGTKYMCLEGGCGVCIVAVRIKNKVFSVNSCLVSIFLCNGWHVITIEGIGNKMNNYNILQTTLAEMNGSQCGYCSPAMVMNMFSLIGSKKTTTEEIEKAFGGNICRCTGYRPILDAFQLFSSNSSSKLYDIEDVHKMVLCFKSKPCKNNCEDLKPDNFNLSKPLHFDLYHAKFFKVFSLSEIFTIFDKYSNSSYLINGGNTGNGVYRMGKRDLYIDINDVYDLRTIQKTDTSLIIGASVPLEIAKEHLYTFSEDPGFEYLHQLADHIDLIGHLPMRNIGTLAGNLMLKHEHHHFPSDLFLILETSKAKINILTSESTDVILNVMDFLEFDMKHKLIYSILIPRLSSDYTYRSYKIMKRAQNAHADVNAGFLFKLDQKTRILEKPNIVFGGISSNFVHASETENFLIGKPLLDNDVLKTALNILDSELRPDYILPDPKPEYRKKLAQALFYKFILSLKPNDIDVKLRSGGTILQRGISNGKEKYDVDKNLWPVNKPITKLEALYQTSGEAEYVNDIPIAKEEVFCFIILADIPGKIKEIDYSEAMTMDGFVAFYSAKDIPAMNISIDSKKPHIGIVIDEPLFAEKEVLYAGQPFGIIAATSRYEAHNVAKKVKLIYENEPRKKPLITIEEVLSSKDKTRITEALKIPAKKSPGKDVKHVIKGTFKSGSQYHYTMEPQTCLCVPIEDGLDVFVTTQFMDLVQHNVALCLGIPENSINIKVRRLGGGYGAKLTRTTQVACACAIVAHKLNRPARVVMTIEDMMKSMGKRAAAYGEYELGVNDLGKIQYLNFDYYSSQGINNNDVIILYITDALQNCYETLTWNINAYHVTTDLPSNTWTRAPGSTDGIAMVENIMEHIAKVTKNNPIEVRFENLSSTEKEIKSMINEIIISSDYENRRKSIEVFNKENRWKKRGISLLIMKFSLYFFPNFYSLVSLYARDGTVSISHGGIEMGQGINTKVAQVAAYTLGIDIKLIKVKPSNNLTAPNGNGSGGSIASDCCVSATKTACEELLERLKPVKKVLINATWQEILFKAYLLGIDLCAVHSYNPVTDIPKFYSVYGTTVAEVEIDVLTGEHIVRRVDLLEDTGISLNPEIDMGQVQGAFIMGLGLWTTEDLIYHSETGELANHRTWNYKPPGAKDIPVDFRVSFLRNTPNPNGILRSKATGEPALCMAYAIPIAIRNCLDSARADAGNIDPWYEMENPLIGEKILLYSLTQKENMTI